MKSKFRSALALVLSLATVMCYSAPVGFAADTDTGQDTPPSAEESVYLLTDYQQGGDDSGTVIKEFYVTADRNSVVGGTGTEIKLEAKIDADNYSGDVTWESSDSSVATINQDGLVTAKGSGTATITVKSSSGNKSATAKITVSNPVQTKTWNISKYSKTVVTEWGEHLFVGYEDWDTYDLGGNYTIDSLSGTIKINYSSYGREEKLFR